MRLNHREACGVRGLTCNINVDGRLFFCPVFVPAAEQAGVFGLNLADSHTAAVVLHCPPTTRFIQVHLISDQACWERPGQLPPAPGQQ